MSRSAESPKAGARTTILIVDDDALIRDWLTTSLRARGYGTISAGDGRQALSVTRGGRADLVLLDVHLPVMDGLGYLQAVAADSTIRRVPVILLTGLADRETVIKAARLGAAGYLLKSKFSLDELVARIERELGAAQPVISPPTAAEAPPGSPGRSPRPRPAVPDENALEAIPSLTSRTEIESRLRAHGHLRALSPTVAEVLSLAGDANASAQEIAAVIRRDPAIAFRVLRLANSAGYARGRSIETVDQAVVRLGTCAIRQAVLSVGVVDRFQAVEVDSLDPLPFWEHSIACGLIAAEITRALGDSEPEAAFTMGLLHDVGRLLLAELLGDTYARVLATAADSSLPVELVERRMLSVTHAEVMGPVLRAWQFPRELIEPIVRHHEHPASVQAAAPDQAREVAVVALANELAHALLLGSSANETIRPTEALCRQLKLMPSLPDAVERTVPGGTEEVKLALLAARGPQPCCRRDAHRAALAAPLRPLFVSSAPELDAYRLLCNRLGGQDEGPPNLAVLHSARRGDHAAVTRSLAALEAAAGVASLPLIVLARRECLANFAALPAARPCVLLETPLPVARFVAAANGLLTLREAAA